MKKSIFAVLAVSAVCVSAAGLSGCKSCGADEGVNDYERMQSLLGKSYSQIVLTVTDTFAENTSLVNSYTASYGASDVTVEYRLEEFTSLSLDAANPQFKTVKEGSVVMRDGVVVQTSGDSTVFSMDLVTGGGINFREEYFTAVMLNDVAFKANVSNPSGFFGVTVACTNMKVSAIYGDYMAEMVITYTAASGHSVEYEYRFTANL